MNILLLEDRGSVSHYLTEELENMGHTVYDAYNINDAKSIWEENEKSLDCIIADLNLETDGLKEDEEIETKGGVLSGWIWLLNYIFIDNSKMKLQIIIYTDYLNYLDDYLKGKGKKREDYKEVRFITKRDDVGPSSELIKTIKKLANKKG